MTYVFALCSDKNPCGNHGIWMKGDRVAITFAWECAPPNFTGIGTIVREAAPRWSGDHLILHVLWDNQKETCPIAASNIVLLPRGNDGVWTWREPAIAV